MKSWVFFSVEEKFNYFIRVEEQVQTIITLNWDKDHTKILKKIKELINIYNSKGSGFKFRLQDSEFESSGSFYFIMAERINYKFKDKFKSKISIKSKTRDIKIKRILG